MSEYTEDAIHQLANQIEKAGFTSGEVRRLGEPENLEGILRYLRGDFTLTEVNKGYTIREDGLIILTVTSHGHNGPEQQKFLEEKGHVVTDYAGQILNLRDFTHSGKGTEIQIGILTQKMIGDLLWTPGNARKKMEELGGITPSHDIGGLLRENLTDGQIKSMGLWGIATLSEPIKDSDGNLSATGPGRVGVGSVLGGWIVHPDYRYDSESGVAFSLPQQ